MWAKTKQNTADVLIHYESTWGDEAFQCTVASKKNFPGLFSFCHVVFRLFAKGKEQNTNIQAKAKEFSNLFKISA